MKDTLLRVLRNKAAWVGIILVLGSLGIKLSPEAQQVIQLLGPEIATEAAKGEHD